MPEIAGAVEELVGAGQGAGHLKIGDAPSVRDLPRLEVLAQCAKWLLDVHPVLERVLQGRRDVGCGCSPGQGAVEDDEDAVASTVGNTAQFHEGAFRRKKWRRF